MARLRKLKSPQGAKTRYLVLAITFFCLALAGINFAISANNHTDKHLVAARDLPAGSPMTAGDVEVAEMNLGASAEKYLEQEALPVGGYLLTPIRKGQLIPLSAMATSVIDERVPVVVESAMGLPVGLIPGASVDVWVTPLDENKVFGEPYVLVLGAEVAELIQTKEMFANQNPSVELWVPIAAVGPLLSSIANTHSISLILRPTFADG